MKIKELSRHGIHYIDGQRNSYNPRTKCHKRSNLCAHMPNELFTCKLRPHLENHGIMYITQTNVNVNIEEDGTHWVTKVGSCGVVYIGLTDEIIHLKDDEVYVVLWNRCFPPKLHCDMRALDVDVIVLNIIGNLMYPRCWYLSNIICMFLCQ
jgi:hypothetical protein